MEKFKLDDSGTCLSCSTVPEKDQELKCFLCSCLFRGTCSPAAEKVASKSFIESFNKPAVKGNFQFFCDKCLTNLEVNKAKAESDRLSIVENSISLFRSELNEIKTLLKQKDNTSVSNKSPTANTDNIWHDSERLAKTKIPPVKPMLVLEKNDNDSNQSIQKVIIENDIPVTDAFKNNAGNLVLECSSVESRDKLKKLGSDVNLELKAIVGKKDNITIVGMNKLFTKEEVIKQLLIQNAFLSHLNTVNDINEHLTIHNIKHTRSNENIFQVFASVSEVLRNGIKKFSDKLTIGVNVCKVYDRTFAKRCNNCQGLGHFYKDCPTPNNPVCAICSESHRTDSCSSSLKKCVNCSKKGSTQVDHTSYDPKCPELISFIGKKSPTLNV